MAVLYVILPLALIIAVIAVAAFIWSVHKGQLDDLETPAMRVLFDDEPAPRVPRVPREDASKTPNS